MHTAIPIIVCLLIVVKLLIFFARPYVRQRLYQPPTATWARAAWFLIIGLLPVMALLHLAYRPLSQPLLWGFPAFIWCGFLYIVYLFIRSVCLLLEDNRSSKLPHP
jgi:hypothetical protein